MSDAAAASWDVLRGLSPLEASVRRAVASRRRAKRDPGDPLLGLYLSEEDVDRSLASGTQTEESADPRNAERLGRLARSFGLDDLDIALLLVAVAPDLDARFERLYGYLHDDITRRRASIGLALELGGLSATAADARRRLSPGSALVDGGLVVVEELDRPFLTRSLRVPDRVTLHLLGDDRPDPAIVDLLASCAACEIDSSAVARALRSGAWLCYLREPTGGAGRTLAASAFTRLGSPVLALDLTRLRGSDDFAGTALAAVREARLTCAGLVAGPVESLLELGTWAITRLTEVPWPLVLTGSRTWDPSWSRRVPLAVESPALAPAQRSSLWRAQLDGDAPPGFDPSELTAQFRLRPEQVARATVAAKLQASFAGRPLALADLRAGARSQNSAGLERLARRIEPTVDWQDLVLPPETVSHLRELAGRARYRDVVLDEWCLHSGGGRGRGITALFSGESGTGKTMAAEVLAGDLGLDLYTIDLATVVDKYIGETEKNLDRIFVEAEQINGVLFFDEADALFGKRSEVEDARDRYANIEVAYLLQRMESFDGIAILATNLRANLDEAFTRRLDALVDFPMPDEEHRRLVWERCLGTRVPRADDLDLDFCARAFELSGGNIRNIALTAAFLAAKADRPVEMADLIRGTKREYRKLGRLCVEAEFGPYHGLESHAATLAPPPLEARGSNATPMHIAVSGY
jgi:hypothetical protein